MLIPIFKIEYQNKDITAQISPYVISVSYSDFEHGQSDEVEIQIEDSNNLWKSSWYPSKGDLIKLNIGYLGEKLLNCGAFEIDEMEFSAPPDTITLKAISTSVKKSLRENNTAAYENKTLKQITQEIAAKHNLTLIDNIQDVKIKRITQNNKNDLNFLKNLAEQYGYIFKISDNKLVFYETAKLKSANSALIIEKKDLISFNIKDTTQDEYKACEVSYHEPKSRKLITTNIKSEYIKVGSILKLQTRCENKEQAVLKAEAALNNKNSSQVNGILVLTGNPHLIAGLNIELKGLYNLSGKYHINSTRHSIDRFSGYKTELEVSRA